MEKYEENSDRNPLILTIDIPSDYYEKEYINLFRDLMDLETICLGIYISDPSAYYKLKSEGKVIMQDNKVTKVVNSYKTFKHDNQDLDDLNEDNYQDILKKISYNNKAVLDYVDVEKSTLPIFITNPEPGFIILEGTKVMVIYANEKSSNNSSIISKINPKLENQLPFSQTPTNSEAHQRKAVIDSYIVQLQVIMKYRLMFLQRKKTTKIKTSQLKK